MRSTVSNFGLDILLFLGDFSSFKSFNYLFKFLCTESLTSFHILLHNTGFISCKRWKLEYDYLRVSGLISFKPFFINYTMLFSLSFKKSPNVSLLTSHFFNTKLINYWLHVRTFELLLLEPSRKPKSNLLWLTPWDKIVSMHCSAFSLIVLFVDANGLKRKESLCSNYIDTISENSSFGQIIV